MLDSSDLQNINFKRVNSVSGKEVISLIAFAQTQGASVSMPLPWEELKKGLRPIDFNIYNAPERLSTLGDILEPVLGKGINMSKTLEKW